ncbi:hypothetical protein [Rubripirellula tenax]|uniref:hypothetical protein n=1 Tax=Rubripirellula tenax TaxID=2528015 RepID=UPI00164441DC|nr:hypothetical protein [Rubripirellula tenax]
MIAKDTARRIGAVSGLIAGWVLMSFLGYGGLMPAAIFGASFCVVGAITAEQWHARKRR